MDFDVRHLESEGQPLESERRPLEFGSLGDAEDLRILRVGVLICGFLWIHLRSTDPQPQILRSTDPQPHTLRSSASDLRRARAFARHKRALWFSHRNLETWKPGKRFPGFQVSQVSRFPSFPRNLGKPRKPGNLGTWEPGNLENLETWKIMWPRRRW